MSRESLRDAKPLDVFGVIICSGRLAPNLPTSSLCRKKAARSITGPDGCDCIVTSMIQCRKLRERE